ncbi:heavy metal translocating P-type ATPase [bacterium]|nr:heavy metal translocating P-type ATPase [bacterium]
MTCNGCKTKVEKTLYSLGGVTEVSIDLDSNSGTISGSNIPEIEHINAELQKVGSYTVSRGSNATIPASNESLKSNRSYKPLIIVVVYLVTVTLMIELASGMFMPEVWMANFMAGFFITFSFFKILDIEGFADAYQSYDLIAKRFRFYGILFPFIELALGLAYILFPDNGLTHLITALIMFVSLIGVVLAVTNKRQIQCACLGTVFNLPMSYVTIIEDSVMLAMAIMMYLI